MPKLKRNTNGEYYTQYSENGTIVTIHFNNIIFILCNCQFLLTFHHLLFTPLVNTTRLILLFSGRLLYFALGFSFGFCLFIPQRRTCSGDSSFCFLLSLDDCTFAFTLAFTYLLLPIDYRSF